MRTTCGCRVGWALNLYYVGALGFYLYTRITELHLGLYNIYR